MKNKFIIILSLLLICWQANAQSDIDNDSLLLVYKEYPNDTQKLNLLYTKGYELRNQNPQLAFEFAKEGLKCGSKIESQKHVAKFFHLFGILYYKQGNNTKALFYHNKALALRTQANDLIGLAHSHNNIGNVLSEMKNYALAEEHYLKALQLFQQLKETKFSISTLINIGVLKHETKDLTAASQNYLKANELAEKINDYEYRAICLNNIGEIYAQQNKLVEAEEYHLEALKIKDLMDNEIEKADSYINLANIYVKQNKLNLAEENLDKTFSICKKYDYSSALLHYYLSKSDLLAAQNKSSESANYLKKYIQLNDSLTSIEDNELTTVNFDGNETDELGESSTFNYQLLFYISTGIILILLVIIFISRNKKTHG